MNARTRKKIKKRERKIIHKILDAVLDINGLQESRRETTGCHPTAFFDFSGHVGVIDVRVYSHGWEAGADRDKWLRSDVDNPKELRSILRELKESGC